MTAVTLSIAILPTNLLASVCGQGLRVFNPYSPLGSGWIGNMYCPVLIIETSGSMGGIHGPKLLAGQERIKMMIYHVYVFLDLIWGSKGTEKAIARKSGNVVHR